MNMINSAQSAEAIKYTNTFLQKERNPARQQVS